MQTGRPAGSVRFSFGFTSLQAAFGRQRPPVAVSCFLRFYQPLCFSYALRGRNRFVSRFYRHSLFGRPSGGRNLFVLRFYGHSLISRPSGHHIFLCVKKDIEERHAKGLQSRPLESGFLYGGSEGRRAHSVRVRRNAIDAI